MMGAIVGDIVGSVYEWHNIKTKDFPLSMRRCGMNGIKGYISIREASYRWGVSERRVNQYCAEGRIPGASRFGRSWAIPENAEKPSDPRFQKQHRDPGRTST